MTEACNLSRLTASSVLGLLLAGSGSELWVCMVNGTCMWYSGGGVCVCVHVCHLKLFVSMYIYGMFDAWYVAWCIYIYSSVCYTCHIFVCVCICVYSICVFDVCIFVSLWNAYVYMYVMHMCLVCYVCMNCVICHMHVLYVMCVPLCVPCVVYVSMCYVYV